MQRLQVVTAPLLIVVVLMGGTLIRASAARADTTGVWKRTGRMATSRRYAQRERLPDGRILVVGGTDTTGVDGSASVFYDTAEIYDPATGTWSATGSLTTGGRALHTSTALPDGKILVAGGWNGSAALSSAEIYNPATGIWSATGSMNTARADHKDTVLVDGRILVAGGFDSAGNPIASAEIFNPATGIWTATAGAMAGARYGHRLNDVGGGKVLVTGGFGTGGVALASSERFTYNPTTGNGTFSAAASLAHARGNHFATPLPTGEILVTGGNNGSGVLDSTELYDPDNDTFSAGGTLNQARQTHGAFNLPNGLVLVSGGNDNPSIDWDIQTDFLAAAELYDRATNTFTPTGSKLSATRGGSSIVLWTGKELSAGGGTNESELYNPAMPGASETWEAPTGTTPTLPAARTSHQQNLLGDGRVLMTGGLPDSTGASTPLKTAVLFDYTTGSFTTTAGDMTVERQQHRNAVLYTGKVLITGGRSAALAGNLNTAELFDPVLGTFAATHTTMTTFRRLHRVTTLDNGKVLITGGRGGAAVGNNGTLRSAQLYDPADDSFTTLANTMVNFRTNYQATLLYTGKVLIIGGTGGVLSTDANVLNTAELFDPATNSFTATGNMNNARNNPLMIRLANGKVLVVGGTDAAGNPVQDVEVYDPATGVFTSVGNMSVARDGHRTTRLDNGRAMIVGGQTTTATTDVTDTAELFNHVTVKFGATDNLTKGRQDFSLTSLPNGRILVAGGLDGAGAALTTAELYTPLIGDLVDTFITTHPLPITSGTSATFEFNAAPAPGSTFHCQLDGGAITACATGQTYNSLAEGSHDFGVAATDADGNTDPTPEIFSWTIDTTQPDTSITSHPATLTNGTSAAFEFSSTEPGSFECDLDGGGFAACTVPKDYNGLAEGAHTFQARAIDNAGNTDATPASFTWTIDTTPPNTVIDSGPPSPTGLTSVDFTFHSTEGGSTLECQLDGGGFGPCTSPKHYDNVSVLGAHSFDVRATDGAGNTDPTPATFNWTVVSGSAPDTFINSGPAADGGATNNTSAAFNFTSDNAAATFACSLDNAAFSACTSPKSYTKLKAGNHNFRVQATAGGVTDPTPASLSWAIDTKAPNTTITSAPPALTKNPVATFTFTSTEGGGTFQCSVDGGAFADCTSPFDTPALVDGKHNFQVKAFDAAGNADKSPAKAKAWTVDQTPPVTTITGKPTDPTTSTTATFKFTSEKKSTFMCQLDGGVVETCKSGKKYSGLAKGPHIFQVQATDAAKNVELVPVTYMWTQN